MTLNEIMNVLEENAREMHRFDRCYIDMVNSGLGAYFNCHVSNTCMNNQDCPYSSKT